MTDSAVQARRLDATRDWITSRKDRLADAEADIQRSKRDVRQAEVDGYEEGLQIARYQLQEAVRRRDKFRAELVDARRCLDEGKLVADPAGPEVKEHAAALFDLIADQQESCGLPAPAQRQRAKRLRSEAHTMRQACRAPGPGPKVARVAAPRRVAGSSGRPRGRRTHASAVAGTRGDGSDGPSSEPPLVGRLPEAPEDVFDEARRLVASDRRTEYGTPVEAMRRVAGWWTLADGQPHTGREVALKLALLKLAREQHQHKRDNLVDAAGYVAIAALCADAEDRT